MVFLMGSVRVASPRADSVVGCRGDLSILNYWRKKRRTFSPDFSPAENGSPHDSPGPIALACSGHRLPPVHVMLGWQVSDAFCSGLWRTVDIIIVKPASYDALFTAL